MLAMPTETEAHGLGFEAFHRVHLPRVIAAGHGSLVERDTRERRPFAIRLEGGGAFTYVPANGCVAIEAGDDRAATVVELSSDAWREFASEIRTAPGLIYAGKVRGIRGDLMAFVGWEPALRALYHGRAIFDAARIDLRDTDGTPLDVRATFTLDSPADSLRHFLDQTGYVVVRDVFSAAEVAALVRETERLRLAARASDRKSWWAANAAGDSVLCRITYAGDRSRRLAALFDDGRIRRLIEACAPRLVAATDRFDGVTILFKNPDIVSGLSDLPWHRDCGLGGHSIICPLIVLGIHLDDMTPETGELRVLPGSWKTSCHFMEASDPSAPKGLGLEAHAGDCTLHYGDIMHAAPPPTRAGVMRTTIYLTYVPRRAFRLVGPGEAYNDVLLADGSGRVRHLVETIENPPR
jgi:ectoine hydroxylase-related dioxygenase (phytanoyl-CoA dioxygenase family)